jgi:hypothetical protein
MAAPGPTRVPRTGEHIALLLVIRVENLQAISRAVVFRLLGHVLLSGVLHVAYQAPDRIKGQYMVCVLYKSCLVLATPNRSYLPYTVVASIGLANGSIEQSDNGRGLLVLSFAFKSRLTT